jgi:hypothetical protein
MPKSVVLFLFGMRDPSSTYRWTLRPTSGQPRPSSSRKATTKPSPQVVDLPILHPGACLSTSSGTQSCHHLGSDCDPIEVFRSKFGGSLDWGVIKVCGFVCRFVGPTRVCGVLGSRSLVTICLWCGNSAIDQDQFGGILHRVVIRVFGFVGLWVFVEPGCHSALKWEILPSFTTDFDSFEVVWIKFGGILDWDVIRVFGLLGFGVWLPFGSGVIESLGRQSRALAHWRGYMTQFDSDPICEYKFLLVYLHDISASALILTVGKTLENAFTCLKFCHLNCGE